MFQNILFSKFNNLFNSEKFSKMYLKNLLLINLIRDIAQLGRAPALGAGGRRFKSYYPDRYLNLDYF